MIEIIVKDKCCGCHACRQICPKQCISMNEDSEGFLYPKVDKEICINCGLCETVCPILHQNTIRKPIKVYAAKNRNEDIRLNSSSGGIFTLLAEQILSEGGIVFGAAFNNEWEVEHISISNYSDISLLQGSKYVQSKIGNTYIETKTELDKGRNVLYSGTPCQIAGLHKYLQKKYDNLFTVDIVCHGVPSPKIWREYLHKIVMNSPNKVKFRFKEDGLCKYLIVEKNGKRICDESSINNPYISAFIKGITLRPSCYNCSARSGKSGADITLADYWGLAKYYPEFDDNKGVSLVFDYNNCFSAFCTKRHVDILETEYKQAVKYNPSINKDVQLSLFRKLFWHEYKVSGINALEISLRKMKYLVLYKLYLKLIKIFRNTK